MIIEEPDGMARQKEVEWIRPSEAAELHSITVRTLAEWRRRGMRGAKSSGGGRRMPGGRPSMVEGYHYYWLSPGLDIRYHRDRLELWLTESPVEHAARLIDWAKVREAIA